MIREGKKIMETYISKNKEKIIIDESVHIVLGIMNNVISHEEDV